MMRAMMIAGALAAAATAANAAEPAACYDTVVVGSMVDHANHQYLDSAPYPADRILPRVQTDTLVHAWYQVAGPATPDLFWARAVMTGILDPAQMWIIYLKNEPDGVPSVVGYRYAPGLYWRPELNAYPAC